MHDALLVSFVNGVYLSFGSLVLVNGIYICIRPMSFIRAKLASRDLILSYVYYILVCEWLFHKY